MCRYLDKLQLHGGKTTVQPHNQRDRPSGMCSTARSDQRRHCILLQWLWRQTYCEPSFPASSQKTLWSCYIQLHAQRLLCEVCNLGSDLTALVGMCIHQLTEGSLSHKLAFECSSQQQIMRRTLLCWQVLATALCSMTSISSLQWFRTGKRCDACSLGALQR